MLRIAGRQGQCREYGDGARMAVDDAANACRHDNDRRHPDIGDAGFGETDEHARLGNRSLIAPTIGDQANAREAEDHHRPSRGFGNTLREERGISDPGAKR